MYAKVSSMASQHLPALIQIFKKINTQYKWGNTGQTQIFNPMQVVGERGMMDELSSLLVQESHPLQDTISALGSSFSNRLIHPKCVKERYRRSFLPAAVRLYNQHCSI